ncbi:unnamed protein product [Arabis nemorensis]|uniref:Uncharacterized protein n=1 Tax=Arabis nemorensis TaxID=586526 RepID=A0A565AXR1_9BRAS|nr:unnamed protein product [Arabis nemorensis]
MAPKENGVRGIPSVPGETLRSGKALERVRGEVRRADRDWGFDFDFFVVITSSPLSRLSYGENSE